VRNKNTEGLKQHSLMRNQDAIQKANNAITQLKKGKNKITVTSVARKAGIAIGTIYNNPVLLERITQLKELTSKAQRGVLLEAPIKQVKQAKIEVLQQKNKELRDEIEQLKRVNALLLGNLEKKTVELLELKARGNVISTKK